MRESNGDEPAAAMQETESSVDSGVDEKVCYACLSLHFFTQFFSGGLLVMSILKLLFL